MIRTIVRAVAALGAVVGGWLLFVVVQHGTTAVYDLPAGAIVAGVVAAVACIAGWWLIARRGDPVALAAAAVGFLAVAGLIAILSIGIFVLVGALVCGLALSRRLATLDPDRRRALRPALAGAMLVAVGLPLAAVVAGDGPIVRCHRNGVSTSEGIFRAGRSGSSSGSSSTFSSSSSTSSSGGVSEGEVVSGGRRYIYRCDGGRLAEFRVMP